MRVLLFSHVNLVSELFWLLGLSAFVVLGFIDDHWCVWLWCDSVWNFVLAA